MSAFLWWRSWHGAPMDAKYAVIANRAGVKVGIVACTMWALLDYASQYDPRGHIDGFDTETWAVFTGFPESEIIATIQAMHDKGMLIDNFFVNWPKRQPKREDDSKERVAHFRELKRNVTQGNAIADKVTTDKDKDKDNKVKRVPRQPIEFPNTLNCDTFKAAWAEWETFRAEKKNKITATTRNRQLAMLEGYPVPTAIEMLNQSITNGYTGLFPLKTNGNGHTPAPSGRQFPPMISHLPGEHDVLG